MKRFLPHSLLGQVMASAMLALLIAQLVGAFLLYQANRDRLELSALTALTAQLTLGPERSERFKEGRRNPPRNLERTPIIPRYLRYQISAQPALNLSQDTLNSPKAQRLRELLELEGITPHRVALELRRAGSDPQLQAFARTRPRIARMTRWRQRNLYVASIQRTAQSEWETARIFERKSRPGGGGLLIAQTLLIYAFLVAVLFMVVRRITRPLAQLTARVDDFSKAPDRAVQIEESGPSDTRRLIAAHNRMEARIAALLDEKDVMLGAIGHDLKTPLAALRVRIESVPDEQQRARMAASIEDITRTLDDILSLARIGRDTNNADQAENVDIGALADSIVEEFEELNEPVTLSLPEGRNARIVGKVRVTWLKRALRNLVSNAVRYGDVARVSILMQERDGQTWVVLRVDDDGPGIDEAQIETMLEPFTRGDASRNREMGGAGLGLTLARAIAQSHGGALVLSNRREGGIVKGLSAEIHIPA